MTSLWELEKISLHVWWNTELIENPLYVFSSIWLIAYKPKHWIVQLKWPTLSMCNSSLVQTKHSLQMVCAHH